MPPVHETQCSFAPQFSSLVQPVKQLAMFDESLLQYVPAEQVVWSVTVPHSLVPVRPCRPHVPAGVVVDAGETAGEGVPDSGAPPLQAATSDAATAA